MFNEIIQKVAKDNNVTYETAYKVISEQFAEVRNQLSNTSAKSVSVANLFTFEMREVAASKKLAAYLSLENKRKYAYDQIESLTKKGIVPFGSNS